MEGWNELLRSPIGQPVVEFDNYNELIWTGSVDGYINSFSPYQYQYDVSLYPYTKYRASSDPIQQIIPASQRIYSLSSQNINVNNKRGIPITNINSELNQSYKNFHCMTVNELNHEIIVSSTNSLFRIDVNNPKTFTEYDYNDNVSFINHQSKFLTLGKTNGCVDLFDHNSNRVIKQFQGHSDGLSDLDVSGNYLVTCGFSIRHNSLFVDPLINIYDLRMMKLLAPIPFPFGPSFVKFHPKLPNLVVIASKNGNVQFLDIFDQSNFHLYQVDVLNSSNYLKSCKFSSNGDMLSLVDNYNNLILWNFNDSTKFNNYSNDLDPLPPNLDHQLGPKIPIEDDNIPLNIIGMPYYKDPLLSNYGSNLIFTKELAKLPMNYDNENLPFMKFVNNKFDHNYNKYYSLKKNQENLIPFISDNSTKVDSSIFKIPNCFGKLWIKYSKFGIEDFNFSVFNGTSFSGLENNLDNSYINSLVQLYKYSSNFQNLILDNLKHEWLPNDDETINNQHNYKGSSVLNELGYLFDMINKANGKNCKISNFSEFLNTIAPSALLNFDDLKTVNSENLKLKILGFNQWMLNRLVSDFQVQNRFNEVVGSLFLIKIVHGNEVKLLTNINLFPINLPDVTMVHHLNYSVVNAIELPKILPINVNFSNKDFKALNSNWLLPTLFTSKTSTITFSESKSNYKTYELLGYVAEINNGPEISIGNQNLISFIKIKGQWYLFNDFLVMKINEEEVLDFKKDNKKPLVLLYESIEEREDLVPFVMRGCDDSILYKDHFALTIREDYAKQYQLLTNQNPPKPGSIIAIDAEFVILQNEIFEINLNGVKNLIKPKKLSLARVSVIDEEENCFIDDYIIHNQHIEDYITSFSGIEPGDLDPLTTTKNLVTFQTSYRRLWLLLNMGCVFVGHGLENDFRTINLHVPQTQIRDTLLLYFLPENKRKLSLKFLSYIVLHETVQVGNHDSIEDAKYALKLYKAYGKIEDVEGVLDNIYYEGQKLKFRVPE